MNIIAEFNSRNKPRTKKAKRNNEHSMKSAYALYNGKEIGLKAFKSGIFPLKPIQRAGIETLLTEKMLQRLPMELAQEEAGNTLEELLNEFRQMVYFFHWAKEITKKYMKIQLDQ